VIVLKKEEIMQIDNHQASHTTDEPSHAASVLETRCTIVHPEYSFLAFDDLLMPKAMTISLTSTRFESDLEDKRRSRIAQEFVRKLQDSGHTLQVKVEREKEAGMVQMSEGKSVLDETLIEAARDMFVWQSGDYNAVVKLRGTVLHRIASAMHQRFVEVARRDPSTEEIAHMKQLVVTFWNDMVCIREGSDPFDLVGSEQTDAS
jgi:hypothetical protein